MRNHPPDPIDYGLMTDNCGNLVAFIRADCLDDIIGDLEAGEADLALGILKELQSSILANRGIYNEPSHTESESIIEEVN